MGADRLVLTRRLAVFRSGKPTVAEASGNRRAHGSVEELIDDGRCAIWGTDALRLSSAGGSSFGTREEGQRGYAAF